MFDNTNQPPFGTRTLFGPQGNVSTVFSSGPNMFTVVGSGDHDGTYFRNGNLISGPDGIHSIVGDGPTKTVFGPHGETHTIIENGFGSTVL